MKKFLYSSLLLILASNLCAQDWERRHQFAKSYFGISNFIVPSLSNRSLLNEQGEVQSFERSGFLTPSINLGATHFWGHADFFISISTIDIKFGEDEIDNSIRLGTFTGLRIYPFPTKEQTIRPYVGYRFSPFRYKQKDGTNQSFKFTRVKSVFDIGLGIQLKKLYLTLDYGRVVNSSFTNYLSKTVTARDHFPEHLFQIGFNFAIETTAPANTDLNKAANRSFSASNRNGFFVGAGFSAAFPTTSSSYVTELYPYLDDKSFPTVFPDLVVGYHFSKIDLVTSLSYRPMKQERSAFGFRQQISRNSIIAEVYKFVGDYHGFAPYVGMGLGYENLQFSEAEQDVTIDEFSENKLSPAILFGWDIRPSEKGDWWVLRTNLRYYPFLEIEQQSKKLSLKHLEFNFIQFVWYPQRLRAYKRLQL
ncbi:MAG: hypothetical protein AAF990_16385 [Bacteroidota bacterium]